ncbi:MAG TPA: DUF1015 domain-containing protein [Dehalococcoidales bacterium]|nr:DUF1015 domain-containing protein [Dehalococcoidales bacterium]
MSDIHPFRGVRYNQTMISELAKVVCPPYDIIPPHMQSELYERSEHNFIRLEHARSLPQDTASENKYTRSASTLAQWLAQGVLTVDEVPAVYLHDHYFPYQGKEYRRRGIIVLVRLEEWERRVIRPHEGTLANPKSDRLTLLRALQADTSSILALFEDPDQRIASVLGAKEKDSPLIHFKTDSGEKHVLWAITEAEMLAQIQRNLARQPLYIADGHHRYESALAYRQELREKPGQTSGDEGFDFVMMTLVDFADPGLVILPPHRLVRGLPANKLDDVWSGLTSFFQIQELPFGSSDVWSKVNTFLTEEAGQGNIALIGPSGKNLLLLKPRDFTSLQKFMPGSRSEQYQRLTVSILDHVILEKLLGLKLEREAEALAYSYDHFDAADRVLSGEYQMAFLISPIKADVIKRIADVGDRMPRKSTYFYPKLPSGLVFYRMADW